MRYSHSSGTAIAGVLTHGSIFRPVHLLLTHSSLSFILTRSHPSLSLSHYWLLSFSPFFISLSLSYRSSYPSFLALVPCRPLVFLHVFSLALVSAPFSLQPSQILPLSYIPPSSSLLRPFSSSPNPFSLRYLTALVSSTDFFSVPRSICLSFSFSSLP